MKCPKCEYLGFETGDRCRNCGYDFSLLSAVPEPDYDLQSAPDEDVSIRMRDETDGRDPWLEHRTDPLGGRHGLEPSARDDIDDELTMSLAPESAGDEEPTIRLDARFDDAAPSPPAHAPPGPAVRFATAGASESALPLFTPVEADDEPLIKLPPAPRPPLQVRRTPDAPRLRAVSRGASRPSHAPVLQFSEELPETPVIPASQNAPRVERAPAVAIAPESSRPASRLLAAAIDHVILLGIDLGIVYFTVRMAGLSMDEWNLLPLVPMLTFLALLKIAYFYAFTAVGGQTIGKMAVGTCVVADDGTPVDAAQAMRRTCAGVLSVLLLGLGFVPALVGDRRALHDRLAGTRVVRLRSV